MTSLSSRNISRPARIAWLLGISVVAVVLDQLSKVYAGLHWKGEPPMSFWGDLFRIEYAENHGAFLSLLANMPDEVRFWILTVINGAVLAGLAGYLVTAQMVTVSTFWPLVLVVAGGLGNLIDRIRFGFVIDFLNLGLGSLRTGIFNIADMFITAGFFLMAVELVFAGRESACSHPHPDDPAEPAAPDSSAESLQLSNLPGQGSV